MQRRLIIEQKRYMRWASRIAPVALILLALPGCGSGVLQDDTPDQPAAELAEQDADGDAAASEPQARDADIVAAAGSDEIPTPVPISASQRTDTITPTGTPKNGRTLPASQLVSRIRAFADQYRNEIGTACDQIKRTREEPALRKLAHQYKLDGTTAMYDVAVEPNPQRALLDMLVLVTLQWYAAESHAREMFPKDHPLIQDSTRVVKDSGWRLAARVMSEKQRRELLDVIDRWWKDHGDETEIWYVRISDFVGYGKGTSFEGALGAVTGLPGKLLNTIVPIGDASSSLDSAAATAERATWLAPRMMILAQWRAEAIVFESLATTDIKDVIASTARAVDVADRATRLAETLPQEIGAQTESILADVADKHEELSALLADTRATIDSVGGVADRAQALAGETDRTIETADTLVASIDQLLASWKDYQAEQAAREDPDEQPGRPFDITEYTAAIDAATETLAETNRVLSSVRSTTEPDVLDARLGQVVEAGEAFVDRATGRLERLVILSAASFAGAGIVIVLAMKLIPARTRSG